LTWLAGGCCVGGVSFCAVRRAHLLRRDRIVLALYAALWVFVKVHSAAMGSVDPDAALRRVMSYNAQAIRRENGKAAADPPAGRSAGNTARAVAYGRQYHSAYGND
jgi:hypothetical protein